MNYELCIGKTVLLVEDSKKVQNYNKRMLEDAGFITEPAGTLAAAWESIERQMPDAIILDIGMPDGNGLDFLRKLRNTSKVPVLLLTGNDKNEDIVKGFKSGCDDYLPKPYIFDVLLVRLKRLLERAELVPERITRGALSLDIQSGRAFTNGSDLGLTPKDFDLLRYFAQNTDRLISAPHLYESVWGQPMIDDNRALKVAASRLRTKLEGSGFTIIFDKENNGYCFVKQE